MKAFLEEINFPRYYYRWCHQWAGFITSEYGEQNDGGVDLHLTGYDVNEHVREWLQKNGYEKWSVVEVLAARVTEGNKRYTLQRRCAPTGLTELSSQLWESYEGSVDWSKYLGLVNVFYSHIQSKPITRTFECMKVGCVTHQADLRMPEDKTFFWLDYLVLRQCQVGDFSLTNVLSIIQDTGFTMIELDYDPSACTHGRPEPLASHHRAPPPFGSPGMLLTTHSLAGLLSTDSLLRTTAQAEAIRAHLPRRRRLRDAHLLIPCSAPAR